MFDNPSSILEALMASEKLPPSFRDSIERIFMPLAGRVMERLDDAGRPCVVGLCGPQGSGKSTGTDVMRLLLQSEGLWVATLSLDDLYLSRAERRELASAAHPLFSTRGPPGSHDVALGNDLLTRLQTDASIAMPGFDKATDDRRAPEQWKTFEGPADVVLFEGWCVGARPEPQEALLEPVNDLERNLDAEGTWRTLVNAALTEYQSLFARIDFQILLQPPSFEVVTDWRREQEAKLRSRVTKDRSDLRVMTDSEVVRFVQHYERLTRHIMREMPRRADALVELGPERELRRLAFRI